MASAINTETRQYIPRGVKYDADLGENWIINPTEEEIADIRQPTEDELRLQAYLKASNDYNSVLSGGFEFEGDVYQSDKESRDILSGLKSTIESLEEGETVRFTLKDRTKKDLAADKVVSLCNSMSVFVRQETRKVQDKEDEISKMDLPQLKTYLGMS